MVTHATFQLARFWSNAEAEAKVPCMLVTAATFQPPMGWPKAVALLKV